MYKVKDLKAEYKKKLITAEQAAAMVKPGDRLHFGLGCGSIVDIDRAIAARADELKDITVISTVTIREKPFETFSCYKEQRPGKIFFRPFQRKRQDDEQRRPLLVYPDDVLRAAFPVDK